MFNRHLLQILDDASLSPVYVYSLFRLLLEREVVLYCDLHGHSRKQNVFIYGCENRMDKSKRLHERIFPAQGK